MKLILATKNRHKVEEFQRILSPLGWQLLPQDAVCPELEIEETGATFAENARLKALGIYRATGLPAIADDSGLCVDALGGAPGVYSARYAGEQHDSAANNAKLLQAMQNIPQEQRTARFVCSICVVFSPEDIVTCEGCCEGTIAYRLHGENGFGYDPLFLSDDTHTTFAELTCDQKLSVSHRGKAIERLRSLFAP